MLNETNAAEGMAKDATNTATANATAFMGEANTRAQAAMDKGGRAIEEFVEFARGNMEAMQQSGRLAAKGAEEIARYSADYGRQVVERANAAARQLAQVKSPTEFLQVQGELAKQALDAAVAEGAKFAENYLKLMGEVSQPLQNRVAMATETMKDMGKDMSQNLGRGMTGR